LAFVDIASRTFATHPPVRIVCADALNHTRITMQPEFTLDHYNAAAQHIVKQTDQTPTVGLILGSGLNTLADQIEDPVAIPYAEIPHFPHSTAPGHTGRLVLGKLAGAQVCAMQGRFHYYEGYSLQQITLPVRVMQRMGVETLIATNAAGGLNPNFSVGDLMLIVDHINFVGMAGQNPLRGPNLDAFGVRFPPANRIYTAKLRQLASEVAEAEKLALKRGVYVSVAGPNFESPAEIRFLRMIGGDAVGMSTVPETLVAHHAGMKVLAISTITNVAIDHIDSVHEPSGEEVNEAGQLIVPRLTQLLLGVLARL
jgi:purine-nucleoside phosphorylase